MPRIAAVPLASAFLALWLSGCETPRPGHPRDGGHDKARHGVCNPSGGTDCTVAVTMKVDAGRCQARVADEIVVVHKRNQVIVWQLDASSIASGYRFAETGIVVLLDNPGNPVFVRLPNPRPGTYRMLDRNPDLAVFKYEVHTVGPTGACDPLDPLVINRP